MVLRSSTALQPSGWQMTQRNELAGDPDLELKLGALVVLLSATLVCGLTPLCVVRATGRCTANPERRPRVLGLLSCFAGGVFLATCLLDLLPDYLEGIEEAFRNLGITLRFPLPQFIMAMGFFLVLVLEQIVMTLQDQPVEDGLRSEERRSLLVDTSIQSHDKDPCGPPFHHDAEEFRSSRAGGGHDDSHSHLDFPWHSSLRACLLVFSLALHSVFEGLALGLQDDSQQVLELCLALVIHKSIIAFSLALKLAQSRLAPPVVAGCLLLFAVMSPLGIALGIGLTVSGTSPRHQLVRATLEGLAVGTFFFITFMEILPHELASARNRIPKVAMLLLGFAMVTGVLFIKL